MKNYLFLVWACFALLFGCVACSDDDKDEKDPELSGIVKTVKIEEEYKDILWVDKFEFSYDSEKRLTKLYHESLDEDGKETLKDTIYFSYTTNKVTVITEIEMEGRDTLVFAMENGRAKSFDSDSDEFEFGYDGTGNLTSMVSGYRKFSFDWKDGNIVKKTITSGGDTENSEYLPEAALNNANIDLNFLFSAVFLDFSTGTEFGFLAGILGNRCKNLVADKEYRQELTFEMQGKYITKIVGKSYTMEIEYAK